jgi:hypothetical protein
MNPVYQKVTMIEDLLDLDEIENNNERSVGSYEKFIRNKFKPLRQSGMYTDNDYGNYDKEEYNKKYLDNNFEHMIFPKKNQYDNEIEKKVEYFDDVNNNYIVNLPPPNLPPPNLPPPNLPPPNLPPPNLPPPNLPIKQDVIEYPYIIQKNQEKMNDIVPPTLTCVDVCNHIDNCRVCKKFYKSNDNMFIFVISILILFILLLLKQVLDMCNK